MSRRLSDWKIWILWLAANVVPWWIGCALIEPLSLRLDQQGDIGRTTTLLLWTLVCVLVGLAQWWVLKQTD